MNYLGRLDIDVMDYAGFGTPARTFMVMNGTAWKLSEMKQATVDRDLDEMLRILSSSISLQPTVD